MRKLHDKTGALQQVQKHSCQSIFKSFICTIVACMQHLKDTSEHGSVRY